MTTSAEGLATAREIHGHPRPSSSSAAAAAWHKLPLAHTQALLVSAHNCLLRANDNSIVGESLRKPVLCLFFFVAFLTVDNIQQVSESKTASNNNKPHRLVSCLFFDRPFRCRVKMWTHQHGDMPYCCCEWFPSVAADGPPLSCIAAEFAHSQAGGCVSYVGQPEKIDRRR